MKNYNKILEAINRGIKFALDDFDDEPVQNIKSKQVQNRDYTKEYLDLMKEVVDLGLPSGTLWCKYNLGVNSNKLSNAKDWYGNYYAWGELERNKSKFSWDNYKFGNDYNKLTKYCTDKNYGYDTEPETDSFTSGFKDDLTQLLPEDDAAYQNKNFYNFKFHMPTKEQCEELINYTNSYYIRNYDPNKTIHNSKDDKGIQGLNGRVFKGKNGNQLFIPAAGYCYDSDIDEDGSYCYLWSSSLYLDYPFRAYYLYFNSEYTSAYYDDRHQGFSIRPVINL